MLKGQAYKIYSISSSNNGTSILTERKEKRPQKLDYDRYLLGRPYEIFKGSVLTLQNKVNTGLIKPSTCAAFLPPVKHFCEMNGIILNWKLIDRLLPRGNGNALDEAYDRQKIQKMLEHCDL